MATAADTGLQPDRDAMRACLDTIGSGIHLVALVPDGPPDSARAQWFGDAIDKALEWAVLQNQQGKNVYWTVNLCRPGLNKKPKGGKSDMADMGDMAGHRFAHVDIDPPKDGSSWSVEDCRGRLSALRYPPSFILFTGGGVAAFWRLDEAVANKRSITDVNRALAQRLGGDNCHNHDRLMRLAGGVNYPGKVKIAAGRVPALAYVLEPDDGVVYPLHALAAEYQPSGDAGDEGEREAVDIGEVKRLTASDLQPKASAHLCKLIEQPKGKNRSNDALACAGYMIRRGYPDAAVMGVLLNPANAVSAHCLDQTGKEQRAAERCIEKVRLDLREQAAGGKGSSDRIGLTDFYGYMEQHNYIYVPSRAPWPAASVNARIPPVPLLDEAGNPRIGDNGKPETITAAMWIDRYQPVEQLTWAPGFPLIVTDRLVSAGGWIAHKGASVFNLYRPPIVRFGNAAHAQRWIDHIHEVYPSDADYLIRWLAFKVQSPGEKINHAIVLGGEQGIGKDTMLEPVKYAVGSWNFEEVSPSQIVGRFNGYLKSVILRVSEARDLGEVDRFAFYEHMKTYTAAPPDVLRVDEKHLREYAVFNVCGVIITTNHLTNGVYLPPDDRRHYVAWSDLTKDDFTAEYWTGLYEWYASGGKSHVAAYLIGLDLSDFNPKAPPPKTAAWNAIVDSNRPPEDAELTDAIEKMMNPPALTLATLANYIDDDDFRVWLLARGNRRMIPNRLREVGYVPVRNPSATSDGLWKVGGARQAIYVKRDLSVREAIVAAEKLATFNPARR